MPAPLSACSIFSISRDGEVVYGQNLDWRKPFPGYVIVNPRGLIKNVVPWKGSWPTWPNYRDGDGQFWAPRYGSVTFTCYGRDFIEGGMNEAGLIVDEASLWAVYPPEDERPGISCPQWMQYQLDNYATIEEVIASLDDLRPDGEGWHYLIADSTGACAVIEYLDGKPSVYRGETAPVCALTNTTYEQALSHIPMDMAFGGEIDIASGSDSYGRFVKMAGLLRDYDPQKDGPADEYAFHILDAVSCDQTLRSVVYDARRKRVLWKTPGNPQVRWLDLEDLAFTTPARYVDIEAGSGNVNSLLADLSVVANRALVNEVLGRALKDSTVLEQLRVRGFPAEVVLYLIAEHPVRGRIRNSQ
jgi:choloylglycine hydrolase